MAAIVAPPPRAAVRQLSIAFMARHRVPRQRRAMLITVGAQQCQAPTACIGLTPRETLRTMNYRWALGINVGRALQKGQRRERRVIGLVPIEPGQVGAVAGHPVPPTLGKQVAHRLHHGVRRLA